MKKALLTLGALLFSTAALAQTPEVKLQWEYDKALTDVQAYAQAVTVDGTAITTAPTCTSAGSAKTVCSVVANQLATGTHTVAISATANGVTAETKIVGISASNAPQNAKNPKITITVTVSVGG